MNEFRMEKQYDPSKTEKAIYDRWLDTNAFKVEIDEDKTPFTIVMPPPNITGQLHTGHALDNTMQDIIIRFKRMQGYAALWVPGTDHASIATEVKITDAMAEEGLTKEDIGREAFLERAWEWSEKYIDRISTQLKTLGTSCDWSRQRFTMDEGCNKAVNKVFVNLYNEGLIYKGNRLINWCPDCMTALSDAEVEHEDHDSHLWHLRYPLTEGDGYIEVATTRPETMLGDTAVAVNPEDERYTALIGETVMLPIMNREIPIIADSYVDKEFGSGAVKITPAHDPNDYDMGMRHGLEMINLLNDDGTLNDNAGEFCGMKAAEGRKAVVAKLDELGCLVRIEDYSHSVGECYRCGTTVEPYLSDQWFVAMDSLAAPARDVVHAGDTAFVPQRFDRTYFNWMDNIRDWCISRQLWWGHQIPAWYCKKCGEINVSETTPTACSKCGSTDLERDPDVLDTWFSSALWPFSTLGWPEETPDFNYFYPTDVLVTGYDIIFFWVARMIFSGIKHAGETPFKHVVIHGMVRDSQGRKMSKSLGNGIDPLEVIDQFGADALRFSLITGTSPGNDMRYRDEKVESARNFANKIWNASRFVLMNIDTAPDAIDLDKIDIADKWILSKLQDVIKSVTGHLEEFELGLAIAKVYDFIWNEFCDWYIEMAKSRLYNGSEEEKQTAQSVLIHVLSDALKLLHPFMPFISEAVWNHIPGSKDSIMNADWPVYDEKLAFNEQELSMERVKDVIRAIRNIRSQNNIAPSKGIDLILIPADGAKASLKSTEAYMGKLANIENITYAVEGDGGLDNTASEACSAATVYVPLAGLIDVDKEVAKLTRDGEKLVGLIKRSQGKLNNQGFLAKAPEAVVEKEKAILKENQDKMDAINNRIKELKSL